MKNTKQIQSLSFVREAILTVAAVAASSAFANPIAGQANQRPMLPGSRAAAMGGAYTAVANDATGSYYNPAGLSHAPEARVEVSATAYKYSQLVYEKAIDDKSFTEESESIFPSFFGGSSRYGWLTVGYSFITLDATNVYQQDSFADLSDVAGEVRTYSRTNQEASTHILAGGTAAVKLSDSVSFGLSSFYYQRNIESSTHQLAEINGGGLYTTNESLKTLNTGILTVVGALLKGKTAAVGAAVRFAKAISDSTKVTGDQILDAGGPSSSTDPILSRSAYEYKELNELNPPTYVVGAAWYPTSFLLLSADALMHEGVSSPYDENFDLQTTYNYSLGIELNVSFLSLRGGYFTNNSMYREPDAHKVNQPLFVNYSGVTGGLGWTMNGVQGMLTAVSQAGKGVAQVVVDSTETQDVIAKTTTYIISGNIPLH